MENNKKGTGNEKLDYVAEKLAENLEERLSFQFEKYEDDLVTITALLAEIKYYVDEEKRKSNPDFLPVVQVNKI